MIFYSVHFNRPDFVEIQKKCIDKIGGTLVVIKNSSDSRIEEKCKEMGISCYNSPTSDFSNSNPSVSHGNALNFITRIIDYSDDWCILDHDFFPVKAIEFEDFEILGSIHGGVLKENNYFWPGFLAGKKEVSLNGINFLPTHGKDTGAGTQELLNRNYRIKIVPEDYSAFDPGKGFLQTQPVIIKFGDFGIHYMNGSEWMRVEESVKLEKKQKLIETLRIFIDINL
jgi:hypothetical protein